MVILNIIQFNLHGLGILHLFLICLLNIYYFYRHLPKDKMIVALNKVRPNQTKEFIEKFFSESIFSGTNILIVVEGHVDIDNDSKIMWKVFQGGLSTIKDFRIMKKKNLILHP